MDPRYKGIESRQKKSRALLHKLYEGGYRVLLSPNGSIRVGHADTGEHPPEPLQRLIIDMRFELKSLCDPAMAEREDLWGKAIRGARAIHAKAGLPGLDESVHEELAYAQEHWEQDDVGGARYHLMRAFVASKLAVKVAAAGRESNANTLAHS